jgi:type III pantothenate kinase
MIIGFDIGNTSTLMGIYASSDRSPVYTHRFNTTKDISPDELGEVINRAISDHLINRNEKVDGFAFSSVVTEVNDSYRRVSMDIFKLKPVEINSDSRLTIKINYDDPHQLGPDRIVNAEAAFSEYKCDCIIVDLGTAVTFCVLLSEGIFDGGIIGPGIGITIDALANRTSKLVKIEFGKPPAIVAKNTVDAIKSGFFYGWLSMVEGNIEKIRSVYKRDFAVILTGGYCGIIGNNLGIKNTIDPMLTMKGIKLIYDLNSTK